MKIITNPSPSNIPKNIDSDIIYNSFDTFATYDLYQWLKKYTPDHIKPAQRYANLMIGPIFCMMRKGFRIDAKLKEVSLAELREREAILKENLRQLVGKVTGNWLFNPASHIQKKKLFFTQLFIPPIIKNVKGVNKVSVDKNALDNISKNHLRGKPFADILLRLSDITKQIQNLDKGLTPDSRYLSSFNIAGTNTFRLSSSDHPFWIGGNLQNIDKKLRYAFIPDDGFTLCYADQQGAESRLVAYVSGDTNYIAAVESGDVHTQVAAMVFDFEPIRDLADRTFYGTKSYRDMSKMCGHASNYLSTPRTIAIQGKIETLVAERFQIDYFKKFPGIKEWQIHVTEKLQETGKLSTPLGHWRTFWDRKWDDSTIRKAIAFGPQSSIGVLMNLGIYNLWQRLQGPDLNILANVHDAILFQVRTSRLRELIPQALDALQIPFIVEDIKGIKREVRIPVDVAVGPSWYEARPGDPEWKQKLSMVRWNKWLEKNKDAVGS